MRIRSLLGKHFFLTRLSCVLLSFGASGKAGGGPRARVWSGPNTSAESQGERRVGHPGDCVGGRDRGTPSAPWKRAQNTGLCPRRPAALMGADPAALACPAEIRLRQQHRAQEVLQGGPAADHHPLPAEEAGADLQGGKRRGAAPRGGAAASHKHPSGPRPPRPAPR